MSDTLRILETLMHTAATDAPLEARLERMLAALLALPALRLESRGCVFMAVDGWLHLIVQHRCGEELARRCRVVAPGECLCGRVLESGEPVHTRHVDEHHEIRTTDMEDHGHLVQPLRHEGGIVGVLTLYLKTGDAPSDRERAIIEAAAEVFALTLAIERKNRELAIRKHEYQTALARAADGILSVDRQGIIHYANPAAHRIFGWPENKLVGQALDVLMPPPIRTRHRTLFRQDLESETPRFLGGRPLTVPAVRAGGEQIRIELSASPPARDADRITIVLRDVTERELQKEAILRMQAAIDAAPNAIFITDPEARILDCNRAFCEQTGYTREQAVGSFASILRDPDADPEIYEAMLAHLNDGRKWEGELRIRRADGRIRVVSRSMAPVKNERGQIIFHVVVQQDITEAKAERERLEHVQRLESLGVLAGGVAHDFNNLLAAIMGNADLARRKLTADHPAQKHLNRITEASQSAAEICQQMMAYAGRDTDRETAVHINRLVESMGQLLEVSLHKGVRLKLALAEGLPPLRLSPGQIKQVVMNLITNANDAIGPDREGEIELATGVRRLSAEEISKLVGASFLAPGDYLFIQVTDNGCGMDEKTVRRIFEPFFSTKFTGRGLGLSALLGIVRKYGGGLSVTSRPGEGSSFEVLLPLSLAAEETGDEQRAGGPSGRSTRRTVLVVDDEPFIREIAGEILAEADFEVLTARNGQEALDAYRVHRDRIGCVLLDMTMPVMDGLAALKEIKTLDPEARVVLCSGYAQHDIHNHVGEGMADAALPKPFQPEKLLNTVESIIARA